MKRSPWSTLPLASCAATAFALAGCSGGDNTSAPASAIDASSTLDSSAGTDATPGADGSLADASGAPSADATAAGDASADAAACDGSDGGPLPDLTTGTWVFYRSRDSAGEIWDGTALKFTSMVPSCGGATLSAYGDWKSTDGQYSTHELYNGTYEAIPRRVSLAGYALQDSQGSVVLDSPVATYDPVTDQLIVGSWSGGHPGTFTARHVLDDGGVDAADGASTDGATE
jgi:hypothetical protein